jgi:hypothetical protein
LRILLLRREFFRSVTFFAGRRPYRNLLEIPGKASPSDHVTSVSSLSVVAAMCGVSRLALYRIMWLDRVSDDRAAVLTPIVRAHAVGKLRCRRSSPNSPYPNHWEIIDG